MDLLEAYFFFQQWKNFENPLRIDKVITVCLVYYFFVGHSLCSLLMFSMQHCIETVD